MARSITPQWVFQILWFIAGIGGTGGVWYFLSQNHNHKALWTGFATVVVVCFTIALHIRNDLIRRDQSTPLEIAIVKDRLDVTDKHLFFQVWLEVNNQSDSPRILYRPRLEPTWIKSRQGGKQLDVIEPSPSTVADWRVQAHSKESFSVVFPFEFAKIGGGVPRQTEINTYHLLAEDNAGNKYTIRKEVRRIWTVP